MFVEERAFHIEVHRDDQDLWAEVSELPGCFATGETLAGLMEALEEAVALYLSDDDQLEPLELRITGLEVRAVSPRSLDTPPVSPPEPSERRVRTPPRFNSPHRDWGFGRFDRRQRPHWG
jgi:predicted RNase H-like HicB family nuclease